MECFRMYASSGFTGAQYFIRDPDLCKQLFVKDFDYFLDRRGFINDKIDKLWGKSLFSMHGEDWRQMRATLSPSFTGSKMRIMFELVTECADDLVKHLLNKTKNGEQINLEMKEFFSRYTNDVIATCAFGIKVNSFAEPENDFYMNVKKVLDLFSFRRGMNLIAGVVCPSVAHAFNLRVFDEKITNKLRNIILDTMETREKNHIYRPDMINILMQVRKGTLEHEEKLNDTLDGFATVEESEIGKASVTRKWNDDEVIAQCLIFLLAGFETSATMLTFTAYEIAINPDVQQKLFEEISKVNENYSGKSVTYDMIQKMKYLDQVVSETLRMYPAAVMIDRLCVKDYILNDGDKLNFKIEKGSAILFSTYSIQRDPKYYPNPNRFDPERFNDENKKNIIPGTYVPFGVGPRNCIGMCYKITKNY